MADMSDGGWLRLGMGGGNGVDPRCEKVSFAIDDTSAVFMDYPNDGHYGWSLESYKRVVKVKNIWFNSVASYDAFMANILALQDGGAFTLQIKITSSTYLKFDGTNDEMPVLWVKMADVEKPYGGASTIFIIPQLILQQAGNLTT